MKLASNRNLAMIDLDGTLINLDWRKNMRYYYKKVMKILPDMGAKVSYLYSVRLAAKKMMSDDTDDLLNIEKYFKYITRYTKLPDEKNREIYFKFYNESFAGFQEDVKDVEGAHQLISLCKSMGMKIVLATNPVFPLQAVKERLSWGKFNPEDFDLITHIQNFTHCKPSPKYFMDILSKFGTKPDNAFMVGDDYYYDIKPCKKLGIRTWWLQNKRPKIRKKSPSGRLEILNDILAKGELEKYFGSSLK